MKKRKKIDSVNMQQQGKRLRVRPSGVAAIMLALPVYVLNKRWNTNYMFLNLPPEGSPLAWFAFLGAPGYLLGYIPLALGVWSLLYGRELWRFLRRI